MNFRYVSIHRSSKDLPTNVQMIENEGRKQQRIEFRVSAKKESKIRVYPGHYVRDKAGFGARAGAAAGGAAGGGVGFAGGIAAGGVIGAGFGASAAGIGAIPGATVGRAIGAVAGLLGGGFWVLEEEEVGALQLEV